MNKNDFSDIRHLLGKTQNQMARILLLSPKAIQSFEQGWRDIPSDVARQMLLLEHLKKCPEGNHRSCWEIKNCSDEWKKKCIVWDLQIKNHCWFFNGIYCQGEVHRDWEAKMKVCRVCEMYKPVNETN